MYIYTSKKTNLSEVVRDKGLEHITIDDLVAEITPMGRGRVNCFSTV